MTNNYPVLSTAALGALATAAERGLLVPPFGTMQIGRHVSKSELAEAVRLIDTLHSAGLEGNQLTTALRIAESARKIADETPPPTLVWSDLDVHGSRDTRIVCEELFREAERSVLLSTFNLGHKAQHGEAKGNPVLHPLARRMSEIPSLQVRLFLNLPRRKHSAGASIREVEDSFLDWFGKELWPWEPVPELYYDPRSLETNGEETACLHAKCVVVDDRRALITSANLTEAGQNRNIEAGVLLEDGLFAKTLRKQFESLIDRGYVRQLARR